MKITKNLLEQTPEEQEIEALKLLSKLLGAALGLIAIIAALASGL